MKKELILAPSILAADYTKLGLQISDSVEGGAQWIHCDVMDGHFVPNISYGPLIVEAANRTTDRFLDVHLMIYNPDQYIPAFVKAGADLISVHQEAVPHLHRTVQLIHSLGIKAGAAINPATPVSSLYQILPDLDLVVVMSVNPGFGGQPFIEFTYQKVRELVQLRNDLGLNFLIEVDGGVGPSNIEALAEAGTDVFVAGSSVFKAEDVATRVSELLNLANQALVKKA